MSGARKAWALALMLATTGVAAQMMGGQHGGTQGEQQPGMGMQQSQQMMGDQMMGQQMMRDMSAMMRDMNQMMTGLSHRMESSRGMDATHRRDMAQLMQEMGDGMRDMAQQMSRGTLDPKAMSQMQERMRRMERTLERMDHPAP